MSKIVLDTNSLIQSIPPKSKYRKIWIAFWMVLTNYVYLIPRAIWLIGTDNYIPEK